MTLDVCPRCLAHRHVARPMIVSDTRLLAPVVARSRPIGAARHQHRLGPDMPAAA
jgi:hypothetical protein